MPDPQDYRELTDLAQDLARINERAARSQITMDTQLRDLAMDRAKVMYSMNDAQKGMIAMAGGQMIQIYKEELALKQETLREQIRQGMQAGENIDKLQASLDVSQHLADLANTRADSINEQAIWMQDSANSAFTIRQIEEEIRDIDVVLTGLKADRAGLSQREAKHAAVVLMTMQKSAKISLDQAKIEKKRLDDAEKGSHLFGITTEQIEDKAKDISAILTNWPVLIGTALTLGIRAFEALRQEAQLGIGQTVELVGVGISGWTQSLSTGVIVGIKGAAEATAALANEFGRMDLITGDLIKKQIRLTTIYGLQGEQSAQLLELLQIVGGESEEFTSSSLQFMENLARANDIPIGALMSDVASSASSFAISSAESLGNLIQSVAQAKRLGLDINKVVGFAESSVMNPDNFIQNITRLRQFGFDVADPIGLLALANDPTRQAELVDEIVSTFVSTGRDLASVSRIERQLLEQTFGMDFEEIRRVAERAEAGAGALRPAEAGRISEARDVAQNLAASTVKFISDINFAGFALNALAAAAALQAVGGLGGLGKFFGKGGAVAGTLSTAMRGMGKVVGGGALLGGGLMAAGDITTGVKEGFGGKQIGGLIGTIAGGAIGSIIPGVGTMIGVGLGSMAGNMIGKMIGGAIEPKEAMAAAGAGAAQEQYAAAARGAEQIIVLDTSQLESKVDELIIAVKTPPPIQMDTSKVTSALRRGEPRLTNTAA